MRRNLNILVAMPTGSHPERLKLEGILHYAHEKSGTRWNLELDMSDILMKLTSKLVAARYDGIIAYVNHPHVRELLKSFRLPIVMIEDLLVPRTFSRRPNIVTIFCDHEAEGRTAAKYFLDRNYRNFAFVDSETDSEYGVYRKRGFLKTVNDAGFDVAVWSKRDNLIDWLRQLPHPCAVFAVHDLRARQVLIAANDARLSVPGDLSVMGVDDDEVLCTTSSPTLSSIPTFDYSLGYTAGRALNEILLNRASGRVIRTRHIHVIARQSTAAEITADPFIAKALNWARDHLDQKLNSVVVSHHAGCSQRYLQERCEQVMGCSLCDAIRTLRLSIAAEQLNQTKLPIADIATKCGFACVSHFARLFKATYGINPLQYRAVNTPH